MGATLLIDEAKGIRQGTPQRLEHHALCCVEAGILAYLVQFPFGPHLPTLFQTIPLGAILGGLLLALWAAVQNRAVFFRFELLIPTLAFFASFAVSIFTSEDRSLSAGRAYFLPVALLFFLAIQVVLVSWASLRRLSFVLLLVVGVIGVEGAYQAWTGSTLFSGQVPYAERIRAGLPHPNDLTMIPLLIPLGLLVASDDEGKWRRVVVGLVVALGAMTVILSESRNALVGLFIVLVVALFTSKHRRLWLAAIAALLVVGGLAALLDPQSAVRRLLDPVHVQGDGRIGLWLSAVEIFRSHPIFGAGPFLFDRLYPAFLEQVSLPNGYRPERGYIPWVHNLYLEALAERGLFGLGAFLALVSTTAHRVAVTWREAATTHSRNLSAALAASWSAFLVMGAFDLTFLKDWVWIVFVLLVSLSACAPRMSTSPEAGR
jgi:O-antigen ligase